MRVQVNMTDEELKIVDAVADLNGMSRSAWINYCALSVSKSVSSELIIAQAEKLAKITGKTYDKKALLKALEPLNG